MSDSESTEVALATDPFAPIGYFDRLYASKVQPGEDGEPDFIDRLVAVDLLRLFIACRIPITLWGPVGARKTRTIEALCREKDANGVNYQVITITPSTQDPAIINGIFYTAPEGETVIMKRSIPDVAKQIVDYYEETGGYTIILADEMTTSMVAQQNALLGLLTHGKFDQFDVSDYTAFVMAANPQGTVSTVNPLGEAVINRGGHIAWYGDLDVFLDEWSTGFNDALPRPSALTEWYIKELLGQAPSEAFRSKSWEPDQLIPWDSMEHTERSTTNLADIITFINEQFPSETPFQSKVRQHYIIEVTKAIQGHDWAGRMARVVAIENSSISPSEIIRKVREAGVTPKTSLQEVQGLFDTLHIGSSGSPLNQAAYLEAAKQLSETIELGGRFSVENYLAFWAFALSSRDESYRNAAINYMISVARLGSAKVKSGELEASVAKPKFLTRDLLANLASVAKSNR